MKDYKVLLAVPALDTMPVQTAYCMLTMIKDCAYRWSFICRASCHDARNMLAREAIDSKVDRVLWLDSDMVFSDDLMIRLGDILDDGWDMACGLFFRREVPPTPLIYKRIDGDAGKTEMYRDYPKDQIFKIEGCGFGAVMMMMELLERVGDYAFTPMKHLSEDLSFCARANAVGARMCCDSRIKIGHVGQIVIGEQLYKHPGG